MRTRPVEFWNNADNQIRIGQLPEHLVHSLRVLFDILDKKHTGFVSFDEVKLVFKILNL